MTKKTSFIVVVLIWAGLYLPGLGILDIDFNEGRRILPAVSMIESGNWMTPTLAGEEYFRKPPMINWMVASSFTILGKDEFTARIPCALSVLAFVALLILMPSWLSLTVRFAAAIIYMSTESVILNGRMVAIDGPYAAVTAMAFVCWLNLWGLKGNRWMLWLFPGILMGLGLMLKGPIILLFFYVPVLCIAVAEGRKKELLTFQHIAGIIVMTGIFLAWALNVKSSQHVEAQQLTGTWYSEIMLTFKNEDLSFGKWFLRVLGAFAGFLPWLILIPLLWVKRWTSMIDKKDEPVFKACRLALIIIFIIVNIMPATKARYSLPVFGMASLLLAWIICVGPQTLIDRVWRKIIMVLLVALPVLGGVLLAASVLIPELFKAGKAVDLARAVSSSPSFYTAAGTVLILAACAYFTRKMKLLSWTAENMFAVTGLTVVLMALSFNAFVLPIMKKQEKGHSILAATIDRKVPDGTLYVFKVESEPFLFYIKHQVKYLLDAKHIGKETRFLLSRRELIDELRRDEALSPLELRTIAIFPHRRTVYELVELKTVN